MESVKVIFSPNFFVFPLQILLKVGLTSKFDYSSRWAVRNQASKFRVFKTKKIRFFKFQIFFEIDSEIFKYLFDSNFYNFYVQIQSKMPQILLVTPHLLCL
jgi:hypothetical protein